MLSKLVNVATPNRDNLRPLGPPQLSGASATSKTPNQIPVNNRPFNVSKTAYPLSGSSIQQIFFFFFLRSFSPRNPNLLFGIKQSLLKRDSLFTTRRGSFALRRRDSIFWTRRIFYSSGFGGLRETDKILIKLRGACYSFVRVSLWPFGKMSCYGGWELTLTRWVFHYAWFGQRKEMNF